MKMEKYFHLNDIIANLFGSLRKSPCYLWFTFFYYRENRALRRASESKLHIAFLLILLVLPLLLSAQNPVDTSSIEYPPIFEIPTDTTDFTLDKLGNVYLITPDNELIKYNKKGEILFRYSENRLGKLGSVDASNPMQILLYYPDFLTVKTLDRTMNPTGEVALTDFVATQNAFVCSSKDNNIWVFDMDNQQLKKINRVGQVMYESGDLRLILPQKIIPDRMMERANELHIHVADKDVFVFDAFGKYLGKETKS